MAFSLFAETPSASSPRPGPVLADTGVTLLPRDKTTSSSFFIQKEALRLTGEIRVRRRAEVRERGAGAEGPLLQEAFFDCWEAGGQPPGAVQD